jgi:hypothetical protein
VSGHVAVTTPGNKNSESTTEWRVTYVLTPHIEVTPADATIPALNLELVYSPEGALKSACHTVQTNVPDSAHAYAKSETELAAFWEALRYRSRGRLEIKAVAADAPWHSARRRIIVINEEREATRLPNPDQLRRAPARLAVWLWLANSAKADRDDAGALRSYYLILEDIHGRPNNSAPDLQRIVFARDFVSHGRIDRKGCRAFLQAELGHAAPHYQYDPHDLAHRKLAAKYRHAARRAVENELQAYL